MVDSAPVFEEVEKNLFSSRRKERISVFDASLASLVDHAGPGEFAELASDVTAVIISTLQLYGDRASRAAVERLIARGLKKDSSFVKTFTGGMVQLATRGGTVTGAATQYELLRWTCLLLRLAPEVFAARAAFTRVAAVQGKLLTALLQGPSARLKTAARLAFTQMLKQVDEAFGHYLGEVTGGTLTLDGIGLVAALLHFCTASGAPPSLFDDSKGAFLEVYIKLILGAREKPPRGASEAFQPLLVRITHEEFGATVEATAVKMLKRNPEVVVEAVGFLVATLRIDMSRYGGDFLPSLLQQARHADEAKRKEGVAVIRQLAKQTSDWDALAGLFKATQAVLAGSEGKLTSPHQRAGMMGAILALCTAPGGRAAVPLANSVSVFLMAAYKDEMNEEVKISNLAALGPWLARAVGGAASKTLDPKSVASFFLAGLKEKEGLRRAHLRALRAALKNGDLTPMLASLGEPLVQLAKNGLTKAAQRVEGIYAMLLALRIAASDMAVEDKLTKEKIWSLLLQKSSPLLASPLVAKLGTDDVLALVDMLEALLLQQTSRVLESVDGCQEACQLLVFLLWHTAWEVRKAAAGVVARCHLASSTLSGALLDAFINWLAPLMERQVALAREAAEGGGGGIDTGSAPMPSPQLLSKALLAITSDSVADLAGVCARLLLAAHHPCLVPGQRKGAVWEMLLRSMASKDGPDLVATLKSQPSIVCKVLLGSSGLLSQRRELSTAGISAVATAMRQLPEDFFPHLMKMLEVLGDRTAHDALTDREIKIYNTQEGVLAAEEGVYVAEVVKDRNVRKGRGRMKMYEDGLDDIQDEEPVKTAPAPKAAAGKGAVGGSSKGVAKPSKKTEEKAKTGKELAREEQLREEAEIRREVQEIRARQVLILEVLGAAASANPVFGHDQLPVLVDFVLPLLKSPLVAAEAFRAMLAVSACVAPSLAPLGSDLAAAICMVATSAGAVQNELRAAAPEDKSGGRPEWMKQRADRAKTGVVERVVVGLMSACQQGPLPAASFGAVFPVIEQILLAPGKTKVHDNLLEIMALHCSPFIALPRQRMIAVLYHVLEYVPSYQEKILPLLKQLCQGLKPHDLLPALSGLYAIKSHVRAACLDAVEFIPALAGGTAAPDAEVASLLWLAQFDPDERNVEEAQVVWDMYGHDLPPDYASGLIAALSHGHFNVRQAAASSLAAAMLEHPASVQETLSKLFALYVESAPPGGGMGDDPKWQAREGVALALRAANDVLVTRDLPAVITFLISKALADLNADVREKMVKAGAAVIDRHGSSNVGLLLPIFENYLDRKVADEGRYDLVREGVVVFLGALAQHLAPEDAKVGKIVDRLFEVLNTPSEAVQRAVASCLPPLMPSLKGQAGALVERLLVTIRESDRYGERRGAAFGLAGIIKGSGLWAIRKYDVIDALKVALEDKNSPKARDGALGALECLCEMMGRLFEPYVINVLPLLLVCFSDAVLAVREAAEAAARAMMGQLSAPGVKLVLPALLAGLEERAWRTKQGSVQLLGAMAYCAPRQLSSCLPTVVPKLSEVLTDTHPKVQAAARTSLQQVGSVIRNPEIAALVPTLLVGIADPNQHTKTSLDILLQTTFVNSVDAPSLALLVPIVHRGLRERAADAKKKAAQVAGNMASLVTDPKDMLPYLPLLLPELKKVLVDPHPEVRSVAARALGSLVKGMGQDKFADLVPWLLATLKSDNASVERSGAAQGLSEVLAALGRAHFEKLLPDIVASCSHHRAAVRDGYLTLFKFLPTSFGSSFQKYLPRVLPAILDGLADENESVRDAALAAGHTLVEHYATSSLPLLLPAVEEGIFNDNWRIRQSSVELLGDLLFKVAGTSGKVVLEGGSDDEGASTEAHGRAILDILGLDRRNEVLAAVYMVRSDVALSVRQAALHVWKTVVANTPKTLKEIMSVLMRTLIASLASTSFERRQVAGRSLGELVRKLGERVLPSIVPILSRNLDDSDTATRQGVCMGLSEVMASASKQQLAEYMDLLIPTIRNALCDSEADVREAAGQAFGMLFKSAGMQAVDEIVPALLAALEDEARSATALDGLKQILSVRTSAVLPHVLPRLVQPPIREFSANALGAIAEVAGAGMAVHLSTVLPPLVAAMGNPEDPRTAEAVQRAAETVALAVDEDGLDSLLSEISKGLQDPAAETRKGAAMLFGHFCKQTKVDLEDEMTALLSALIILLTDNDESVVKAAWEALGHLTSTIPKEQTAQYLKTVRDAISTARDKERRKRKGGPILLPGLCLPKALQPLLQIYLQGLMSGSAEVREAAAEGLGEAIDVTSEAALRPFVVPITGPLIRIIGDRFPWAVKAAILATLGIVIGKGGAALKPFLPQLQTTFIKCLQDSTRTVRSRAAKALGKLSALNPRVDPLVNDLITGMQGAEGGVKDAMLAALKGVVRHAGKGVSPPVKTRLAAALQVLLSAEEDQVRSLAGRALGILSQYLSEEEFKELIQNLAAPGGAQPWTLRHGCQLALASVLRNSVEKVAGTPGVLALVTGALRARAADDKVPVRECAAKGIGRLLAGLPTGGAGVQSTQQGGELLPVLAALLGDEASDVRRQALGALKAISKAKTEGMSGTYTLVGPPLAECLKDSSQPVRLAAERSALHLFQLSKGGDGVQVAQKYITGLDARRISKYPSLSDASDDSENDGVDD